MPTRACGLMPSARRLRGHATPRHMIPRKAGTATSRPRRLGFPCNMFAFRAGRMRGAGARRDGGRKGTRGRRHFAGVGAACAGAVVHGCLKGGLFGDRCRYYHHRDKGDTGWHRHGVRPSARDVVQDRAKATLSAPLSRHPVIPSPIPSRTTAGWRADARRAQAQACHAGRRARQGNGQVWEGTR